MNKLDFTKNKLEKIVIELANLNGYDSPIPFLNELLEKVKSFNDYNFTCNFYINIHHLCNENADKFWSELHREEITKWLKNVPFITNISETTWINEKFKFPES